MARLALLVVAGVLLVVLAAAALLIAVNLREVPLAPEREVVGGDRDQGARVMVKYGCGACHVVPGVRQAVGLVGPPLDDFAARAYVAGNLPNTPENLVNWIMAPQEIEPGTAMPDLGVTEDDARDIAAYLYSLR